MNKLRSLILSSVILAVSMTGLVTKASEDFTPAKFGFDTSILTKTSNFEDETGMAGVGFNAFFTDNIGLRLEAWAAGTSHRAIDQTNVQLLFRNPVNENFAITLFGGGGRDWETQDFLVDLGVGVEQRIYGPLALFGDVRWEKYLDRDLDHQLVVEGGIRIGFGK